MLTGPISLITVFVRTSFRLFCRSGRLDHSRRSQDAPTFRPRARSAKPVSETTKHPPGPTRFTPPTGPGPRASLRTPRSEPALHKLIHDLSLPAWSHPPSLSDSYTAPGILPKESKKNLLLVTSKYGKVIMSSLRPRLPKTS